MVPMRMELKIRFDYGSIVPWVRKIGDATHATGGPEALVLRTPADLRGEDMTTVADFVVAEGHCVCSTWPGTSRTTPSPTASMCGRHSRTASTGGQDGPERFDTTVPIEAKCGSHC